MSVQSINEFAGNLSRACSALSRGYNWPSRMGEAVMTQYRCQYMLGDRVQGVKMIVCPSDADMMIQANDLLDLDTECDSVEVWADARLVARLPRGVAKRA
jgi:hypothetical protein